MKSLAEGLEADMQILDSLNTCTTCSICKDICPANINCLSLVEDARKELVSRGVDDRKTGCSQ